MSERSNIANRIAQAIAAEPRFNAPYGVLTTRSSDARYYVVTFGRARILDAEVRVYGPKFILLKWRTAIRWLPKDGLERVYDESQATHALQGFLKDFAANPSR
jgi:hypothetical protein